MMRVRYREKEQKIKLEAMNSITRMRTTADERKRRKRWVVKSKNESNEFSLVSQRMNFLNDFLSCTIIGYSVLSHPRMFSSIQTNDCFLNFTSGRNANEKLDDVISSVRKTLQAN